MRDLAKQSVWHLFDIQKRPVQYSTGRVGYQLADYETLKRIVGEPDPLNYYRMGIRLRRDLHLVCIDIDQPFTPTAAESLIADLRERFEFWNLYAEYSLSGNLHIFLFVDRIPDDVPTGRAIGRIEHYPCEVYWDKQSILLTERTVHSSKPTLADYRPSEPLDWYELTDYLGIEYQPDRAEPTYTATNPPAPKKTRRQRKSDFKPQRRNIFAELIPLFPSFFGPTLQSYAVYQPFLHDRTRLRRPHKDHSHSATYFHDTGVFYNFSTNWHAMPTQQGITITEFLARAKETDIQTIVREFYQYLKEESKKLKLPIPRRKRKHFFTLKRNHYHMWHICTLLAKSDKPLTLQEIQTELEHITQYPIHRTTLQKYLYQLIQHQFLTREKINGKTYHYTLHQKHAYLLQELLIEKNQHARNLNQYAEINALIQEINKPIKQLDSGWIFILFSLIFILSLLRNNWNGYGSALILNSQNRYRNHFHYRNSNQQPSVRAQQTAKPTPPMLPSTHYFTHPDQRGVRVATLADLRAIWKSNRVNAPP